MNKLSQEDKRRLWQDTKSCHVTAPLDKSERARCLQPLPTLFELQGQDCRWLTLITPPRPAAGLVGRALTGNPDSPSATSPVVDSDS